MNTLETLFTDIGEVEQPHAFEKNKLELVKDIAAFASILIKLQRDDILMNQTLFIEVLNGFGFRTTTGEEFTKMSFRMMIERLRPAQKYAFIEEFKSGHRDFEIYSAMFRA